MMYLSMCRSTRPRHRPLHELWRSGGATVELRVALADGTTTLTGDAVIVI